MSIALAPCPLSEERRLPASVWEKENARRLRWLALTLVLLGLAWRFSRYLLRFPIWGDEAMLLVNYFNRDYLDLIGPIDNCQVAPLLFHWIELTVIRFLGADERLVRLAPFLASLANVALFWRLARLILPPLARTIAVGILVVAAWPVTMGAFAKPYAGDLFFSLVFLISAVSWLRRPSRGRRWRCWPGSPPSPCWLRIRRCSSAGPSVLPWPPRYGAGASRKTILLFVLYNLLLVGTFAGHYLLVSLSHLASPMDKATTADGMYRFWCKQGVPPLAPLRFIKWFFLTHTGEMAAYPLGSGKGSSALTALLGLVGLWNLYRHGQRELLVLVGGAFGLGFLAALLRRYPYGTSCRVVQHLAPFYCLLMGLGVSVLIQRLQSARGRWKATMGFTGFLALIAAAGVICDCCKPYRDRESLWARRLVNDLVQRAGDDPILMAQDVQVVNPLFHFQLLRPGPERCRGPTSIGRGWPWSIRPCGSGRGTPRTRRMQADGRRSLAQSGRPWRCVEYTPSIFVPDNPKDGFQHCQVYHWVCEP